MLHKPVMVIDDDALFANIVGKMVGKQGYLPVLSFTMEDALKNAVSLKFAFVITDIYMPGMGGIKGIKALRKRFGDIKIIAMSGGWGEHDGVEALSTARKMGADWALKKPFTADELNEAISCILDGRQQDEGEAGGELQDFIVAVVEDDPLMSKVIASTLGQVLKVVMPKGVKGKVVVLDDAKKALDVIKQPVKPNVIITDLNMPGMDGLTLLRHLAKAKFSGGVCLVTGEDKDILNSAETLARSHGLNFVGALQKPVMQEDLVKVISAYMEMQKHDVPEAYSPIEQSDIRRAITEGQVEVHYQPKVTTKDKALIGVEALVRWRHPELGLLFPDSFIPFAEKHGLIDLLTDAVVVAAIEAQGTWKNEGMDIKVSINLSTYSLGRLEFPEFLVGQAKKYGSSPKKIIVEITEGGVAEDNSKALEVMSRLRLKGFGLSIDDYGTGYSSLSRLKEAPFNELKIDRAFVAGAPEDDEKRAILETSVDMAKKLGVSIVAEGVETQEDWDLVAKLGVDLVQGYFISRPMPSVALLDWAKKR